MMLTQYKVKGSFNLLITFFFKYYNFLDKVRSHCMSKRTPYFRALVT